MKFDEINPENLSFDEIEKMPPRLREALSQRKLHKELAERLPKINAEPRDWSIPIKDPDILGVLEEPMQPINHLIIGTGKKSVIILGYAPDCPEPVEIFTTREKIESFIATLIYACDKVFIE